MTRSLAALLFGALVLCGAGIGVPASLNAAPHVSFKGSSAKKHQKRVSRHTASRRAKSRKVATKKKRISTKKAFSVLREYLPQYADIHETKSSVSPVALSSPDFDYRSPFASPRLRRELIENIDTWIGTRYRFGGRSKRGIDCSGFTSTVISHTLGISFSGTAHWQATQVTPIFNTDSLQFGDLIFFTGRNRNSERIGHVGIYLGNGVFAHSSTANGVIYTHLSEGYYSERFRRGGRFIEDATASSHWPSVFSAQ
jgi:cell wall-associated NlpC family hydrolase